MRIALRAFAVGAVETRAFVQESSAKPADPSSTRTVSPCRNHDQQPSASASVTSSVRAVPPCPTRLGGAWKRG